MTAVHSSPSTSRLARLMTRAPQVLSRTLWMWPLLGAVLFSLVGLWTRSLVESTLKIELASRLQTLLNADVAALRLWYSEREADANALAADSRVQQPVAELVAWAHQGNLTPSELAEAGPAKALKLHLEPVLESQHYLDYIVVGPDRRILASPHPHQVGRIAPLGLNPCLRRALDGVVSVSRPFDREASPAQRAEGPTMFVAAPVKSTSGSVVAVLGLRMQPDQEFSHLFSVARLGESGEAYAFDFRGMMLTASRFDRELKTMGLLTNTPEATAILNVRLADPGDEPAHSQHPSRPESERPLTRMAAAATKGLDGYDVDGYRNYRGTKVIGAWSWLPEYGLGVATEVATEEAFQTLYVLRRVFLALFFLLVLSGAAIFAFTVMVERLQASVRKSALAARRLGQYALVQEIGRGANGMVYRARHSLLRRPVAIKLLSPEMTNEATAARFEHEVQMTSQLTHPNTVAIYDYGRTPEGLFYYAMEFLNGINLDRLVREFGPQPEGRVIHILRQVCGSLAEAHRIGLIHRDVKPANIVLTRRGGVCDLVKVLDFGLVKAVNLGPRGLAANAVVGTPHFMSPEAVEHPESVDCRSDLYSVGVVGYWLLTGTTPFQGDDVEALLDQQVHNSPPSLSQRRGQPLAADLEQVMVRCLMKRAKDRPQSAEALDAALAGCAAADAWTASSAANWWDHHLPGIEQTPAATMPEKTLVIAPRS